MKFPTNWNDPIAGTPEERARTIASRLHSWCQINAKPVPDVEYQSFMIGLFSRALGDDDNAKLMALAPDLAAELAEAHRVANELELEATTARNRYVDARNRQLALHHVAMQAAKDKEITARAARLKAMNDEFEGGKDDAQ